MNRPHCALFVLFIVALALLLWPAGGTQATPGAGGALFYSVEGIGPVHDISPGVTGAGDTCTPADILIAVALPALLCPPRLPPAPPGPVPGSVTMAPVDLGLNFVGGPFTDDLDALSFGEALGVTPVADFDFSVGPAPVNGGTTVGVPGCVLTAPNVTSESAALEAQGDVFTTAGAPPGCNTQSPTGCPALAPCDEAMLGLIAPNPGAPAVPPLDNVDALAEPGALIGPCTLDGGGTLMTCPAFSLTPGSVTLPFAAPDFCVGAIADAASILVPPGAPGGACMAPCIGPLPCVAVHSALLGLLPGDDLDALCWWDVDGDMVPSPPPMDLYMFSLTAGSASVAGPPFYSPADVMATTFAGVAILAPGASLGLLPTDELDALICHDLDDDLDGVPDALDDFDLDGISDPDDPEDDGDGYTDVSESGSPLCLGMLNNDAFDDLVVNDGCPAVGMAEALPLCAGVADDDFDGAPNDGCPIVGVYAEGAQCSNGVNDDAPIDGAVNDGCPALAAAELACAGAVDDDGDGIIDDGCPVVPPLSENANNTMTGRLVRCEAGPPSPSPGWPSDLFGGILSEDNISVQDLSSFIAPVYHFATAPGAPGFHPRWDIAPGTTFGATWINIVDLSTLIAVTPTGYPPMPPFGGVIKAFGGPDCFDPP